VLEDTLFDHYENLIHPFPNSPTIWRDLFEQKDPIIDKNDNDSCPSLDPSTIGDEANLQNIVMECDSSPTRVDNMEQENENLENKDAITNNHDIGISPPPNISVSGGEDILDHESPICPFSPIENITEQ
jgi:hypothetical protein